MKYVVCNNETWRLLCSDPSIERLFSIDTIPRYYPVHVEVYAGWEEDVHDDTIDYLEKQLEALADFSHIFLYYVDEFGWLEAYKVESTENKQRIMEGL